MPHNQLIIETAKALYLKHGGTNHRAIEREMRRQGCLTFSRRVLHSQKTKRGTVRPGWIERFGWRDELKQAAQAETRVSTSVFHHPQPEAELKQDGQDRQDKECAKDAFDLTPDPADPVHPVSAPTEASRETDFQAFLKRISPTMTWDWEYQKLIYEQLERITSGESRRLMIFLPPRHGKSELVTNRYAAWRLKQNPSMNIILGSYNQRLANRFSRKVRITFEDSLSEPPASAGGLTPPGNPTAETPRRREDTRGRSPHEPGSPPQHLRAGWPSKGPSLSEDSDPIGASSTEHSQDGSLAPSFNSQFSTLNSPLRSARARLNTVSEWETGLGGGVRAVGVGGGITGFGADLVIIDDPIKSRAEAESETYRERVWDWFNDDLYTRLEPNASIILIQTRWHEDDLAGRLLREASEDGGEHWDVISLPALAEDNGLKQDEQDKQDNEDKKDSEPVTEISDQTPYPAYPVYPVNLQAEHKHTSDPLGRRPGEALCPDRFTREDLLRIKRKLGSYSFSALYQQRPTPPEGGLFKRAWFKRIVDRPPENLRWARGYDLAVSTRESADFTASFRCAFDKKTGDLYIADGFRKRMEFPEQKRFITEKLRTERNTEHGIEHALHAQAFVQELRRQPGLITRPIRLVRPAHDKFTRALSWANLAEEGKVVLVRGTSSGSNSRTNGGSNSRTNNTSNNPAFRQPNWIEAFLEEITTFPNSAHDDQLDAVSTAVQMLERHNNAFFAF